MTRISPRTSVAVAALAALSLTLACTPPAEQPEDAGTAEDAGPDAPVDAGYDAGPEIRRDGGPGVENCPSLLTSPLGTTCLDEGHICRQDGCIAPGPNCLFIECICESGTCSWVNQATLVPDAGPTDAGPADAGTTDAGPVDAGATDAGPVDAGTTDAGTTDAGYDAGYDAG